MPDDGDLPITKLETTEARTPIELYEIFSLTGIDRVVSESTVPLGAFDKMIAHIPTHGSALHAGETGFEFQGWLVDILTILPKLQDSNRDPFAELIVEFAKSLELIREDKHTFDRIVLMVGCSLIFFHVLIGRKYDTNERKFVRKILLQLYLQIKRSQDKEKNKTKTKTKTLTSIRLQYDNLQHNLAGGHLRTNLGYSSWQMDNVNYISSLIQDRLDLLKELFSNLDTASDEKIKEKYNTVVQLFK